LWRGYHRGKQRHDGGPSFPVFYASGIIFNKYQLVYSIKVKLTLTINAVILSISAALVVAAWCWARLFHGAASAQGRYYLSVVITIGASMALITTLRLIRHFMGQQPPPVREFDIDPDDRRQHYRIMFDRSTRPVFLQKFKDPQSAPAFTCPVSDVSETGIRLVCTDVYRKGQTVNGEIIFSSGRTAPINGVVTWQSAGSTCLDLHCTIPPAVVMAEQREQIMATKAKGPRPPGDPAAAQNAPSRLPSYQPKGICRSKPTGSSHRR
jgi:hypothetical protein